ncbi:hypothetical protein E8E11_003074 [Didymella keratinophila]|uniref:Uncharacterized protein n=1 Tax=Didymella heteroderae TaxID=1769908 RepID=A0A9P4WGB0_9PLEO|nr:hypothetical protein E8E12_002064 [Didymella heteroderae]KAF3049139.1 hypothetical protein E8E11_003074 [Didymella keratinophila]
MEHKGKKPLVRGPNPAFWQCFAKFAISRGFKTSRAKELSEGSCASELALDYLRKANPLSSNFDAALVEKVINAGRSHSSADAETIEPDTSFITVERRCGRPYELDLAKDKRALFFRHLYIESEPNEFSLTLVRRDLFSCIFGPFHFQPTDIGSLVRPRRTDAVEEAMDVDEPFSPEFDDMLHLRYKELQQAHETQDQAFQQMSTAKSALEQQLAATRKNLEQLRSHHTTIQDEHARCVDLQAQNSALQTQISTLQAESSEKQTRLEASLNSRDRDTQVRVQKIVELEHSKKELHDQIATLISACEGAAENTKAAEKREQSALAEVRYYKREAEDLQAQINQQMLAIEEAPIPQEMGNGSLAIPRNPVEVVNMMSDVTTHSWWMGSNIPYILFVAIANVDNGVPKGFECVISKSADEASETIAALLGAIGQRFSDVKAWDARGKAVLTSSISYVFEVLSSGTVFLGPKAVFDTFLDSGANEAVLAAPRKIKQIKRVARSRPEGDKNYRAVVRYESNSENEIYESAADEVSFRQRKVPPPQLTIESTPDMTTQNARIIEEAVQTRPGDLSDSESYQSNESSSFLQRSARFK